MSIEPLYKNKDWLFEEYYTKFRSTTNIADEYRISYNTVLYWLKKFGFKPRTKSEALSGEHNPAFDKEVSEETRKRISKSGIGRVVTAETREKISKGNSGQSKTEEHKGKLSAKALIRYANKENHPMFGKKNSWGKHTPEALKKISESKTGSNHPMYGCTGPLNPMYGLRGPEHPAWVENKKNTLYESIRHLPEYYKWRLDVMLRDKLVCQVCCKQGYVEAHHLYPFALIIHNEAIKTTMEAVSSKNLWDIDNGQSLCESCHRKTNSYAIRLKKLQELYPNDIDYYYSIQ
jgi:hypothetical protein